MVQRTLTPAAEKVAQVFAFRPLDEEAMLVVLNNSGMLQGETLVQSFDHAWDFHRSTSFCYEQWEQTHATLLKETCQFHL
jgi:hypothetical protein